MLAQLLSGVASGIGDIFSQKSANKTNLKIAQMNNEWSEKMMDKQNQYDIDMWNRNNEYNSPTAQVERLKAAGLNPALMMGTGAAGTATGSSSVGLPSPSSASVQPLQFGGISKAIESSIMLASQLARNSAETNFINTQSDVLRQESKVKIAEMEENIRGKRYDTDFRKMNESIRVATENEQYLQMVQNRDIQALQKVLMGQTRILNDINITNLPDQMKADLALKLAQAESLTMPELAKELKFFEKRFGHKITRSELRTIFNAWKFEHNRYKFGGLPDLVGGGISGGISAIKNSLGW